VVCREQLALVKRAELASKLRAITGWPEIEFDESGTLRVGSAAAVGGSQSARGLLNKAISGSSVLILEDASDRPDVVFCRVVPGRWTNGAAKNPDAFVVLIDFADFDHLMGDAEALRSFNVGWGFLHEIDHVVNDSPDPAMPGTAGDCEDQINQMRRECNLPLRTDYFFTFFPHTEASNFRTRLVRLAFDQKDQPTTKRRRYWLIWDATLVGGVDAREQIAASR
jgi:hypothetical protein